MREHAVLRIAALRRGLDAQLWKFQRVRLDPGDVGLIGVLLDADGLKGGLGLDLVEALTQEILVHGEPRRERGDQRAEVFALHVLAREDDIVDRARVNQELAVAVEDYAARRRDRQ